MSRTTRSRTFRAKLWIALAMSSLAAQLLTGGALSLSGLVRFSPEGTFFHLGIVLASSVLLATVAGLFARRSLQRQTEALKAAVCRIRQERDFSIEVERLSDDELGDLADTFNAMLETLAGRDRQMAEHRAALERKLEDEKRMWEWRDRAIRQILDALEVGLVQLDRKGVPGPLRSAQFDRWFGAPEPGQALGHVLGRVCPEFERMFDAQWSQLVEGFLPLALNLTRLPVEFSTHSGRHYAITYKPLGEAPERLDRLLVLITDVTERVELHKSDSTQLQLVSLLERIASTPGGFTAFFRETVATLERLMAPSTRELGAIVEDMRTLQASLGLLGLKPLAQAIEVMADSCVERGEAPSPEDRAALRETWQVFSERARAFLGESTRSVTVDRGALERLVLEIQARPGDAPLRQLASRLMYEPIGPKLSAIGEQARELADQLGRGPMVIDVQANGVVAPPNLDWLWQMLPQVVVSSVDHALPATSASSERSPGKLRIAAIEHASGLVIEIEDDGRGIDWDKVRARAERLGLPATTHEQLVAALFAERESEAAAPMQMSGEDLGLAAFQAVCDAHGARIGVESVPGKGTLVRVVVSNDNASEPRARIA